MVEYRAELCGRYPILAVEDGMSEDDWDGWAALTERRGGKVQLVGDEIFVTNPQRIAEGIGKGVDNSILVKVNQISNLSETLEAVQLAQDAASMALMTHRAAYGRRGFRGKIGKNG